mmetsp:Transcript_59152/g.69162  ORF Transcript_59152/g.69162 Transcript_59152/m.69162 type:complete len:88 (+) Transcript_59152:854-1117(+)
MERKQNLLIFLDLNYYFKSGGLFPSTSTSSDIGSHRRYKKNIDNSKNSGGNTRRKNSINHQSHRKPSIDHGHNHNARQKNSIDNGSN